MRRWLWPHIGWRRMGTYVVKRVTRLSGTPHSIAAGAACGVAVSFTPFIGFHLISAFLLCLVVRGNYLAAATGTLVGNPWTVPFLLLASYQLGHALLGGPAAPIESLQPWNLATLFDRLEAVFWPMALGSLPLGLVAGLATYFSLVRIVAAYQERRVRRRQSRRAPRARPASPDPGVP
jgi:uncharacterized protein (DUF2062 family)